MVSSESVIIKSKLKIDPQPLCHSLRGILESKRQKYVDFEFSNIHTLYF